MSTIPAHMEAADLDAKKARIYALLGISVFVTLACTTLCIATVLLHWPSAPLNYSIGIMLLSWGYAFECRRDARPPTDPRGSVYPDAERAVFRAFEDLDRKLRDH